VPARAHRPCSFVLFEEVHKPPAQPPPATIERYLSSRSLSRPIPEQSAPPGACVCVRWHSSAAVARCVDFRGAVLGVSC
jgi:hypothetical protein